MDPSKLIRELGRNDVLLGRGTGPNENEGNKRFRTLIHEAVQQHQTMEEHRRRNSPASNSNNGTTINANIGHHNTAFMDGKTTAAFASKIVETIHSKNGHFVRKLNKQELNCLSTSTTGRHHGHRSNKKHVTIPTTERFIIVTRMKAIEKTRQAFRFQKKSTPGGGAASAVINLAHPPTADTPTITLTKNPILVDVLQQSQELQQQQQYDVGNGLLCMLPTPFRPWMDPGGSTITAGDGGATTLGNHLLYKHLHSTRYPQTPAAIGTDASNCSILGLIDDMCGL